MIGRENVENIIAIDVDDPDIHQLLRRLERHRILDEGAPRWPERVEIGPWQFSRDEGDSHGSQHQSTAANSYFLIVAGIL